MSVYNSVYWSMGMSLLDQLLVSI
ncbi:hypothetical protein Goarm_010262, partial [Gossypium armourianum]|nr:hypothetical protein [Gossypium armourianum]